MKIILIIFVALVFYTTFVAISVYRKIRISQEIVKNTQAYQLVSNDREKSFLVLGDSTAVGVGVSIPEDSVPALYARYSGATSVENLAVSGSKIPDIDDQIQQAKQETYSDILLQIGGNDIVARKNVQKAEQELRALLASLPEHAHLTVLICGDVGSATIIPWFLRPSYTKRTLEYHAMYEKIVPQFGGVYVNLYTPKIIEAFEKEPDKNLAADQFHPSSAGYALWLDEIISQKK